MEGVLELKNVTKRYGKKTALDDVTLNLPKGAVVGLLGPNGSGKTTMLKMAAGLLTPTSGEILACGMRPGAESKALVAYQSDRVYLNDWMNVEKLVRMMADFFPNFDSEKAYEMLSKLKISPSDRLRGMSKGTKEKVQLILTMSRKVPLYILDEPIGGVDPAARDYILETILKNYGTDSTILISTHLITDIEKALSHIVFIKYGKIVRQGNANDIREETGKTIDELFREEFRC